MTRRVWPIDLLDGEDDDDELPPVEEILGLCNRVAAAHSHQRPERVPRGAALALRPGPGG